MYLLSVLLRLILMAYVFAFCLQMNASYYSTKELDRATHNEELVKGDDIEVTYILHIYTNTQILNTSVYIY